MYPVYKYIGKREECEEVNLTFPAQHQSQQPGFEYLMQPRPISENPYATSSQKLKDKVGHRTAALCTPHCNTCVAPDVRAVLI